LTCCTRWTAWPGVHSTQRCPVQQPIGSCLGYRPQIVTFTAWQIQVEPGQGARPRERAILAVAGNQLSA
jgi:hypothetical protein